MDIFLSAGEESGDLYWSLIGGFFKKEKIRGYGGKRMIELHKGVRKYSDTDFAGFSLPPSYLYRMVKKLIIIKKEACSSDIFVGIGLSEFNMFLSLSLKNRVKKRVCYLPPQIWAWGERRRVLIKRAYDEIISVFPFEYAFYKKHGFGNVFYFGNPLCNILKRYQKNKIEDNTILIFGGSREKEIKSSKVFIEDLIAELKKVRKNIQVFYAVPHNREYRIKGATPIKGDEKYEVLSKVWFSVVYPGTATLEVALLGVPHLVFYPKKPFWANLVKIKSLSLAGIVLRKKMFEYVEVPPKEVARKIFKLAEKRDFFEKTKKDLWKILYQKDALTKIVERIKMV